MPQFRARNRANASRSTPAPKPLVPATALLAVLVLTAMCGATMSSASTGARGFAALGDAVQVGRLTIKPIAVQEDSRCASASPCTAPGKLVIEANVGDGAQASTVRFALGESRRIDGVTIELDRATPAAADAMPIAASAYHLHFRSMPG